MIKHNTDALNVVPKIKEVIDNVILKTIEENIKTNEQLLPVFYVGTPSGMIVIGTPFTGNDDQEAEKAKDMAMLAVKNIAQEKGAEFIIFVSEAWCVHPNDANEFQQGQKEGKWHYVAEFPKRKEVVIINIETATRAYGGMSEIKTGRKLGEVKIFESKMQGRFADLLGEKPNLH